LNATAVVIAGKPGESLRVAGIHILDRLIVVLRRGGCDEITIVSTSPLPPLRRSAALGITPKVVASIEDAPSAGLFAESDLVVVPADVRATLEAAGHLVAKDGSPLPLFVRSSTEPHAKGPAVTASPIARVAVDSDAARRAEKALWASLSSSADGAVDRWLNRPLSRPLTRVLVRSPITPNQVTLGATAIGLVAAWRFAQGTPRADIEGALLFQLSAIVDCIDGDIARATFQESPLGKWLDIGLDQVVHVAIFIAIALAAGTTGALSPPWPLALGISAAVGTILSFVVVTSIQARRSRRARAVTASSTERSSSPVSSAPAAAASPDLLDRLIDSTANRDFSIVLILFACLGITHWFLSITAIGVHAFWIIALVLALRVARKEAGSSVQHEESSKP